MKPKTCSKCKHDAHPEYVKIHLAEFIVKYRCSNRNCDNHHEGWNEQLTNEDILREKAMFL